MESAVSLSMGQLVVRIGKYQLKGHVSLQYTERETEKVNHRV